jgi:hypothetical protein
MDRVSIGLVDIVIFGARKILALLKKKLKQVNTFEISNLKNGTDFVHRCMNG